MKPREKLKKWLEGQDKDGFAKKIGMGTSGLYQILNGNRDPSTKVARQILELTGINWLE